MILHKLPIAKREGPKNFVSMKDDLVPQRLDNPTHDVFCNSSGNLDLLIPITKNKGKHLWHRMMNAMFFLASSYRSKGETI